MNKEEIRTEAKARIRQLDGPDRQSASIAICGYLTSLADWKTARRIFLYASLPSEPNLSDLWLPKNRGNREFYLPRLSEDGEVIRFHLTQEPYALERNSANFFEPRADAPLHDPANPPDLILVPGLAFSHAGVRVGRGRGHYDRLLPHYPSALKIGIAFSCQIFKKIRPEPHDFGMDLVITEVRAFLPLDD